MDAEAEGQDVDAAVLKGIEKRRKIPASLLKNSFTGTSLDDVPGVAVEAYVIEERVDALPVMGLGTPPPVDQIVEATDEPEPNVVRIGRLPSAFGSRRPHLPAS